jgi:hypothetical protein
MEQHDSQRDDCTVRLLEMTVDNLLSQAGLEQGHGLQFWRDCKLYGVDEAVQYLARNLQPEQAELIVPVISTAAEIKAKVLA